MTGNLTWNANGTLGTLGITDPFNSSNQQTCTYAYDDLARIQSANCGAIWSQTFTPDKFGNLSKSGTISFQPTYNTSTNRVSQVGSVYPGYDTNGNLTNDGVHSYAWDADGNSVTIDSIGLTFDALGRMVEQNRSGVYTQVVYGPTGSKLALMNGQTLAKGFVPLAGGATAVYNSGGLAYYRHSDWLGSSRLASTPSRTVYYDGAYAPYGENYAETGTTDRAFTGQNQDTISSGPYPLYDFLYREHHPVWGRWLSPDPLAGDVTNPQSLNRYAYVLNNPTNLIDPLGLDGIPETFCNDFRFATTHVQCPDIPRPWGITDGIIWGRGDRGGGAGGNADNQGGGTAGTGENPPSPGSTEEPPFVIKVTSVGVLTGEGLAAAICAGSGICEAVVAGALVGAAIGYTAAKVQQTYQAQKRDIRQFDDAVKEIQRRCGRPLSKDEQRQLHDEIHDMGLGYQGIVQWGVDKFCPGK